MLYILYIHSLQTLICRIASHMFSSKSLTPIDREINKKLVKIIHALLMMEQSAAFRKPVPHKALGLQDYKLIIKKPTDLNLIRRQNNENKYKFLQEILDEIQLCWDNCKLYNAIGSQIYEQAIFMENHFDKYGKQILPDFWKDLNREEYNQKFNEKKIEEEKLKKPEQKSAKKEKEIVKEKEKQKTTVVHETIIDQIQKQKVKKVSNSSLKYYQRYNEVESQHKKEGRQIIQPQDVNEAEHQEIAMHIQQQKESMEIEPDQQGHQTHNEPIMVNLHQNPTKEQLASLSNKVKQLYQKEEFSLLQKILQILHTHQKQNMTLNKNSQMTFKMNNIHISTFYRVRKLVEEGQEQVLIIE